MAKNTRPSTGETPKPQSAGSASPTGGQRRRWRRWLAIVALILLVLAFLPWLALQTQSGRQAISERLLSSVRNSTGMGVELEDFDLELSRGRIELHGLKLAESDQPWLVVPRAEAQLDLFSLIRGPLRLRSVQVDQPLLDLGAQLPQAQSGESEPAAKPPDLSIDSLRIRDAAINLPPPRDQAWVKDWQLQGLDLAASLAEGQVQAQLDAGRLLATLEQDGPWQAELGLALNGPLQGPLQLSQLSAKGRGLDLSGQGKVGLSEEQRLELDLQLSAQPGEIAPSHIASGNLELRGKLDLRHLAGDVQLQGSEIPASVLEPWLSPEDLQRLHLAGTTAGLQARLQAPPDGEVQIEADLRWESPEQELLQAAVKGHVGRHPGSQQPELDSLYLHIDATAEDLPLDFAQLLLEPDLSEQLELTGTRLDLDADLSLVGTKIDRVLGEASMQWSRDQERLLDARASAYPMDGEPPTLWVSADLLPSEPGQRSLVIGLVAPNSWAELAEGRLASGAQEVQQSSLKLSLPDLGTSLTALRQRWPRLIPELPVGEKSLAGPLESRILLSGTLGEPKIQAEATWQGAAGELQLSAQGEPLQQTGSALLSTEALNLADLDLGPDAAPLTGTVQGRAEIVASATAPQAPKATLELSWQEVDLVALAALGADPDQGASLGVEATSGDDSASPLAGRLSGQLRGEGWLGDARLQLELEGDRVRWVDTEAADLPLLERLSLSVEQLDDRVELRQLKATRIAPDGTQTDLEGRGGGRLSGLDPNSEEALALQQAQLDLSLTSPLPGVAQAELGIALEQGQISLDLRQADTLSGPVRAAARLPLGTLAQIPQLEQSLRDLPAGLDRGEGPLHLRLEAPGLDSLPWMGLLGLQDRQERLRANLQGELWLDPARPALSRAQITLSDLDLEAADHRLQVAEPLELSLAEAKAKLLPFTLLADGRPLEVEVDADLAEDWRLGDEPVDLVSDLRLNLDGTVEAALLTPYLPGGVAEGPVAIKAWAEGPPLALRGSLEARAPQAEISLARPYPTQLEGFAVDLSLEDGLLYLTHAGGRLNDGEVALTGTFDPLSGDADLRAQLLGVRYRVDYGLSLQLSGDLRLQLPSEGQGELSGEMRVDRGLLRRDIRLENEVLRAILSPTVVAAETAPDPGLAAIDLDLTVSVGDGVRVENNIADLRLDWRPLEVTGTLAQPLIRGRVDARPGGRIFVAGQVLRVDRGSLTFPGVAGLDPVLDYYTTNASEDPTIRTNTPGDLFGNTERLSDRGTSSGAPSTSFEEGLQTQLAGKLGEAAFGGQLSFRPIYIFGETNPDTRLSVSRTLSPYFTAAVSVNVRDGGSQLYILELHSVPVIPSLVTRVFTTDQNSAGLTAEQELFFGHAKERQGGLRLDRFVAEGEGVLPLRSLRRLLPVRRGDPLPDGLAFDYEVDVSDMLRQRGYPSPKVQVELVPSERGEQWRNLQLQANAGPRAEFDFQGTDLPTSLRRSLIALYRVDAFEQASLLDMGEQARLSLRGLGYLDPKVEFEVSGVEQEPRRVVVKVTGGERWRIGRLEFPALDEELANDLAQRFATPGQRLELATGEGQSDARLLAALASEGYPQAEITARQLSDDHERLELQLRTGKRQVLGELIIDGLAASPAGDSTRHYTQQLSLEVGSPARRRDLARAAFELTQLLQEAGYAKAQVRAELGPMDPQRPELQRLTLRTTPGATYRIGGTTFSGLQRLRESSARRLVGLPGKGRGKNRDKDEGPLLSERSLRQARRQLFDTGLFSRVTISETLDDPLSAIVDFDVQELPRYRFTYGLRWDTEDGYRGFAEVVDRNFLGRAVTLGLRADYSQDDEGLRLISRIPRLGGSKNSLELYGELRERTEDGVFSRETDATFQLSRPLGEHWTGRLYGRWSQDLLRFEDDPFDLGDLIVRQPVLGMQLIADYRDDPFTPTRGWFLSTDLSASDEFLGGDVRFLRSLTQASLLLPVGELFGRPLTWGQAVRLGIARAFDGQELLRSESFLTGGPYSVRGYGQDSIGPRDFLGQPRGGEALLVVNQELRMPVWGDLLSGVLFFDAGNAWQDRDDLGSDLLTSIGFGLRASTPLGLIRLDLARPLDRRDEDENFKFHFGFGHAF